MKHYNPSDVGVRGSIFGYPYTTDEAELILVPVPWDVTVSYRDGASGGPAAILAASPQLDLSLHHVAEPWNYACAMLPVDADLPALNAESRPLARQVIHALESGLQPDQDTLDRVNEACHRMVCKVEEEAARWLDQGKIVAVVGGDHSTPLGLLRALSRYQSFGILQIDAHMDLRQQYEGFIYSHASVMYQALQLDGVTSLVQVGIRDYCQEESQYILSSDKPIHTFYDDQVKEGQMVGESWSDWTQNILLRLPQHIYISFDIDGLQPDLCPHTGTPVPGGLSFAEITYLLKKIVSSGRKIIGFDLCEVAPGPDDWDANVGARILYRLVTMTGLSHAKLTALL